VNDEFVNSRRQRLDRFDVVRDALVVRLTPVELDEIVEHRQVLLVERRQQTGSDVTQPGIGSLQFRTELADKHDRQVIVQSDLDEDFEQVRSAHERPHVRVEMAERDAKLPGVFDLRTELDFNFIRLHVRGHQRHVVPQIAVLVDQARHLVLWCDGPPAVVSPFRIQRQVDAVVVLGMCFREFREFRDPAAWHHDAARFDDPFLKGFDRGNIHRMAHPGVVGMDDQIPIGLGGRNIGRGGELPYEQQAGNGEQETLHGCLRGRATVE